MESPMKTTRFSPGAGAGSFKSASLYFASQGQSVLNCSWWACSHADMGGGVGAFLTGGGALVSGTSPGCCAQSVAVRVMAANTKLKKGVRRRVGFKLVLHGRDFLRLPERRRFDCRERCVAVANSEPRLSAKTVGRPAIEGRPP